MNKPDFSGTWKFNGEKSKLEIQPPDSSTFVVVHQEPHFRLQRTLTFGEKSDTFVIDLVTDGHPVNTKLRDLEVQAHVSWEDETLVFHSDIVRGEERGINVVRYQLADGGRCIIALEKLNSAKLSYTNIWVLDKQG